MRKRAGKVRAPRQRKIPAPMFANLVIHKDGPFIERVEIDGSEIKAVTALDVVMNPNRHPEVRMTFLLGNMTTLAWNPKKRRK